MATQLTFESTFYLQSRHCSSGSGRPGRCRKRLSESAQEACCKRKVGEWSFAEGWRPRGSAALIARPGFHIISIDSAIICQQNEKSFQITIHHGQQCKLEIEKVAFAVFRHFVISLRFHIQWRLAIAAFWFPSNLN